MAIRRAKPMFFQAKGVTDSLDGTNSIPGSMASLQNLVPDPTTDGLFICRVAAALKTSFGSFTTPGFISCLAVVGTLAYGMVASGKNAGHDEPFVFDLVNNVFVTVGGTITGATTPTSPATTGAWTPPTMAVVGSTLLVTHPGFPGGGGAYFGWFDISNLASPVWHSGNTATNALPAVPVAVAQFANRAWFAVNNAAYFSDILGPTTITNASQVLTLGDNLPVTAFGGLPLTSTQVGGVVQSLIAFKGSTQVWQITGDAATSNLALSRINVRTGTLAPNTIVGTPEGLAFMAPDGLRFIDAEAQVTEPIGIAGEGVSAPFIYSTVPSRMAAAYNVGIIRITTQNSLVFGNPAQEWWYDLSRKIWTGPHTSAVGLIAPYANSFVLSLNGVNAKLFQSDPVNVSGSTYTENGTALNYTWLTSLLPDTKEMAENAIVEATLALSLISGQQINVSALDEQGAALGSVSIMGVGSQSVWGNFNWGGANWGGGLSLLSPRLLNWKKPIEFKKLQMQANGTSGASIKLGNLYMRYQVLKYIQQ